MVPTRVLKPARALGKAAQAGGGKKPKAAQAGGGKNPKAA
jgi:hypothetical protein